MRPFASPGLRLWSLSRETRVVYTGFSVMSLLALLSSALLYEDLVGGAGATAGVKAYYAGEAAGPTRAEPPRAGGPAIDLPASDDGAEAAAAEPKEHGGAAQRLTVAASYRKLLEVTHFHLFTVPVFLLIVGHLFLLTGLSASAKMAWIIAGWLAALGHLAAPWVVHYGGAGWAASYPVSGAAFAVTSTVLTAYPVWAMWRPPAGDARGGVRRLPSEPPGTGG